MQKVLNYLGLAKRAGKIILGTDAVCKELPKGKVKLIFVASDASPATADKISKKGFYYQVLIIDKFSSEELSQALGVTMIKIVALCDEGFAKIIKTEIERDGD